MLIFVEIRSYRNVMYKTRWPFLIIFFHKESDELVELVLKKSSNKKEVPIPLIDISSYSSPEVRSDKKSSSGVTELENNFSLLDGTTMQMDLIDRKTEVSLKHTDMKKCFVSQTWPLKVKVQNEATSITTKRRKDTKEPSEKYRETVIVI
ncbi:hypothetical protein RI129_011519 [Pyrocoelia pectoralis]|uniref:Uncharacterized protein n=1 Tax=Pyrocoelia pectoralis TaxID=417401 RepID=A0AAN7V091_9COLE